MPIKLNDLPTVTRLESETGGNWTWVCLTQSQCCYLLLCLSKDSASHTCEDCSQILEESFFSERYISILIAHTSLDWVFSRVGPGPYLIEHLWSWASCLSHSKNLKTQKTLIWFPAPPRLLTLDNLLNLSGLSDSTYKVSLNCEACYYGV